jgi:hypothetical protein
MGNFLFRMNDGQSQSQSQPLFGATTVTIPASAVEDHPPICETCRGPQHIQEAVDETTEKIQRTYVCIYCKSRGSSTSSRFMWYLW